MKDEELSIVPVFDIISKSCT